MPTLLSLESSSATPRSSVSRRLTRVFVDAWLGRGDDFLVVGRDLHAVPLPHLPDAGLHWVAGERTEDENPDPAAEALQAQLLRELDAADVVLIGAPLYNWSMPSSLKAWVDHVHVVGATVPPESAPQSQSGKPVVLVSPRGLEYGEGTELAGRDYAVPALEQVLGAAMGMVVTSVTVELTLAGRLPELSADIQRSKENELRAREELRKLAGALLG